MQSDTFSTQLTRRSPASPRRSILVGFGAPRREGPRRPLDRPRRPRARERQRSTGVDARGHRGKAKAAGLSDVDLPTCSVAGQTVDNGTDARCFAQYMRVDALHRHRRQDVRQMPRFASKDGKGTNDEAEAVKLPSGSACPARPATSGSPRRRSRPR